MVVVQQECRVKLCRTLRPSLSLFRILATRHPNPTADSRFALYACQSRFRNSIIVTLRNSRQGAWKSQHTCSLSSDNVHERDPMTKMNSLAKPFPHAIGVWLSQTTRRTPPLGVDEDTKEEAKGKRWPQSAAKFYGISLVYSPAVLLQ